jgi:hypothetical protein
MVHSIGVFGQSSNITAVNIKQYKLLGYKGVRICLKWTTLQPTETDLSFTTAYEWIKLLAEAELDINIQIWVGNHSPIGGTDNVQGVPTKMPDWLAKKGVNVFYTTGHQLTGPWPNYYETAYTDAFKNLHRAFANFLHGLPANYQARVKSVFVSNGATGDAQPYKGDAPAGWQHIGDDEQWNTYCKGQWDFCWSEYAKNFEFMTLAFNPSNNAETLQWCVDNYPGAYLKHGDASHGFPIDGETYKMNWPPAQYFGEVDEPVLNSKPCVQFQTIRSALHVNEQRLEFLGQWLTNRYVPVYVAFFHKYVDEIYNENPAKGFCALAEKVDFLNTTDYPVGMFGAELWDDQRLYDGTLRRINETTPDRLYREQRYVNLAMNRTNAERISAFENEGYSYNSNSGALRDSDYYTNDISYYVTNNYFLHVTQLLPFQTSKGLFRVDGDAVYGRNARQFKLHNGKNAMYFQVNQAMKVTDTKDKVRISVTYKDIGVTIWSIRCALNQKCTVTNTNTNEWKKVMFDVENFKFGGRMDNGADFILILVGGDLFPIDMVEFENIDKIGATPKDFDVFGEAGIVIGEVELDPEDTD